jgi:hypothetical protein
MAGAWRQRWSAPRALAPTNLKVVVIYFVLANTFYVKLKNVSPFKLTNILIEIDITGIAWPAHTSCQT